MTTARLRWRRQAWLGLVSFVVFTTVLAGGWFSELVLLWIADCTVLLGAVVATIACSVAAKRRPDERRSWVFLAVAAGCWTMGETIWNVDELLRGEELPFPSIADVFYLGAVPPALVGITCFGRKVSHSRRIRIVLDGALLATALTFLAWALVMGEAWDHGATVLEQVVSAAYPVTDVALATAAVLVALWGRGARRMPVHLLVGGFLMMAVADTAFTWATNNDTYSGTATATSFWFGSYVLFALAALHPAEPVDADDAPTVDVLATTILPYVPFGFAVLVGLARFARGGRLDGMLGPMVAALVVVLLARQAVSLAENRRLALDLEGTLRRVEDQSRVLEHLASHDALTGLANRTQFSAALDNAIAEQGAPAVLYIDLDGFKDINDTMGHGTGDLALVEAARRLASCVGGPGTLIARLGGDEFVILVEAGLEAATEVAFAAIDQFREPFWLEGQRADVGISVGIADAPAPASPDEVVRRADAAMYAAKLGGKGRAVVYPSDVVAILRGPQL